MKAENLRLLLGVSGGIAAYKIPGLIRLLQNHSVDVKVVLTKAAGTLVGEDTLRAVSGNPVFSDEIISLYDMDHIRLAEWADLFVICPATANTLAKLARGIADNLLTTLALSFDGTLMAAPAMNTIMWENPATRDNVALLKKRGVRVLPVSSGPLACGGEGAGRMLSVETIAEYILGADLPQCFIGKKILIASGATEEPLDPVRIITNRSSGRMGAALASAALCMGAEVTVVSGPSKVVLTEGITLAQVSTSAEMAKALDARFNTTDICIMAAAIGDFRPSSFSKEKIKRSDSGSLSLTLTPIQDISANLGKKKEKQFLVCFSLETDGGEKRAFEKMRAKGCDMMVYNTANTSLSGEQAQISILAPDETAQKLKLMDKRECARILLQNIAEKSGLPNG